MATGDKWSTFRAVFTYPEGCEIVEGVKGPQRGVPRLLTEVFLMKEGFFVAWQSVGEDGMRWSKCIVLGGVRCSDTQEAKAIGERLREGLSKCDCSVLVTCWNDPEQDWRIAFEEGPWFGLKDEQLDSMKRWFGDVQYWLKVWEAFGVEQQKVEKWLRRDDFEGEEVVSVQALIWRYSKTMIDGLVANKDFGDERKMFDRRMGEKMKEWNDVEVSNLVLRECCETWWRKVTGEEEEDLISC